MIALLTLAAWAFAIAAACALVAWLVQMRRMVRERREWQQWAERDWWR